MQECDPGLGRQADQTSYPLSDLVEQRREISEEITALRAEVAAPPPPAVLSVTPPVQETVDAMDVPDAEMGPFEVQKVQDDGTGVGFAQPARKRVKKDVLTQRKLSWSSNSAPWSQQARIAEF